MLRRNTGQSIVEYAILLGIIIAALLVMQVFIKRGYQGGLKDSADKMGEQFSAGNTTMLQKRAMTGDQTITEEVATNNTINSFVDGADITGTVAHGVYSYTDRSGAETTSITKVSTDDATQEATRVSDFAEHTAEDYTITEVD